MKIHSVLSFVLVMVAVFGAGCASKMDVRDKVVVHKMLGTNIVTDTFTHTDKSRVANGGSRNYNRGNGVIRVHWGAAVGGSPNGGPGYPMEAVPISEQERRWENTQRQYGIKGESPGSYYSTQSGSYQPTPMGTYSPTPMR